MKKEIKEYVYDMEGQVIEWFHYLHMHPELGFAEENTAAFVIHILEKYTDMEVQRIGKTGVVGRLKGGKTGSVLAFRADMDALPIFEDPGHEVCSLNDGVMHACGHDGHTAALLGVSVILSRIKELIRGEICVVFQPAEEVQPGGAKAIHESGVLDGVERIFGLHFSIDEEVGYFSVQPGDNFAANYKFDIQLFGKEGHAAFPHLAQDMILASSELICALNRIVSRNISPLTPALLSVTKIQAGSTYNSLPYQVSLGGTFRFHDPECGRVLENKIQDTVLRVAQMYEAKSEVKIEEGCGPLRNDEETYYVVKDILEKSFGSEKVLTHPPVMGCEDFSEYLKDRKGCYFRVGARYREKDGSVYPTHNSGFRLNEKALVYGMESILQILLQMPDYLK